VLSLDEVSAQAKVKGILLIREAKNVSVNAYFDLVAAITKLR